MEVAAINGYQVSSMGNQNESVKTKKGVIKEGVGEFVSELKKGTGITANGNEYKKATGGKIVGTIAGAAIGFLTGGIGVLGGLTGLGAGILFDHFVINKERAAQADGEAARLNINA